MPNVQSQSCSPEGIGIVASSGEGATLTPAEILAAHQAAGGNVEVARAALAADLAGQLDGLVTAEEIAVEYDPVTGAPTGLWIGTEEGAK